MTDRAQAVLDALEEVYDFKCRSCFGGARSVESLTRLAFECNIIVRCEGCSRKWKWQFNQYGYWLDDGL